MSLINDALKRAHERSVPAGYAISAPPPADYHVTTLPRPVRRHAARRRWAIGLGLVAGVAVVAGAIFLIRRPSAPGPTTVTAAPVRPVGTASVAPTKPSVEATATVPAAVSEPQVNEDQVVNRLPEQLEKAPAGERAAVTPALGTAEPVSVPVVASAPGPTLLVLQGISRYAGLYEAMINNSTVRVGEEVDGARVLAIEARAVRLTRGGEVVTLRLR